MKSKEELQALKEEFRATMEKMDELTEDEMVYVTGGEKLTEKRDEWKLKNGGTQHTKVY